MRGKMTGKRIPSIIAAAALITAASGIAQADDFYKGKTLNFIVGFAPGGGYDRYARVMATHIVKHIPGNPSAVTQNMTGAGSVRAANHVYAVAAKDGTVIAAVNQNMPMFQILGGKAAKFEAAKLQWLGSMGHSNGVLYTWHTSPTKSVEDAMKRETLLGGSGTNSDSHIFPTLINGLIGTKFKVINGYSGGSRDINLAVERGEVEGRGGNSWASLSSSNAQWLEEKRFNFIVQIGLKPEPELSHVPMLQSLVKTEDDQRMVRLISLPTVLGYAHWLAPEVPADRIAILRKAYAAALKDPELIADANKSRMILRPQTGPELDALVREAAAIPKPVLERTAKLLEWK